MKLVLKLSTFLGIVLLPLTHVLSCGPTKKDMHPFIPFPEGLIKKINDDTVAEMTSWYQENFYNPGVLEYDYLAAQTQIPNKYQELIKQFKLAYKNNIKKNLVNVVAWSDYIEVINDDYELDYELTDFNYQPIKFHKTWISDPEVKYIGRVHVGRVSFSIASKLQKEYFLSSIELPVANYFSYKKDHQRIWSDYNIITGAENVQALEGTTNTFKIKSFQQAMIAESGHDFKTVTKILNNLGDYLSKLFWKLQNESMDYNYVRNEMTNSYHNIAIPKNYDDLKRYNYWKFLSYDKNHTNYCAVKESARPINPEIACGQIELLKAKMEQNSGAQEFALNLNLYFTPIGAQVLKNPQINYSTFYFGKIIVDKANQWSYVY